MIVDGQQRMVTLTLLFIAVRDYLYKNPGNTNPNTINGMCLKMNMNLEKIDISYY